MNVYLYFCIIVFQNSPSGVRRGGSRGVGARGVQVLEAETEAAAGRAAEGAAGGRPAPPPRHHARPRAHRAAAVRRLHREP